MHIEEVKGNLCNLSFFLPNLTQLFLKKEKEKKRKKKTLTQLLRKA